MKQRTLQIKTHIQNINIANSNIDFQRKTLKAMVSAIFFLTLVYVFILANMTFSIVERKALEKEASVLSNEVRDLELSYLSVSRDIDLALSSSLGFKEAKPSFATRKTIGYNVSAINFDKVGKTNNEI